MMVSEKPNQEMEHYKMNRRDLNTFVDLRNLFKEARDEKDKSLHAEDLDDDLKYK